MQRTGNGLVNGTAPFEAQFPELDSSLSKLHGCAVDNLRRLDDLRRALVNLREGVGPSKEQVWPHLLAKFHLVSKTYLTLSQNLVQAMRNGNLLELVIFPKNSPADPNIAAELLRTRIETEPRKDVDDDLSEIASDKAQISKRIQEFNYFVDDVVRTVDSQRRDFDAAGKDLKAVDVEPSATGGQPAPEERLIQMVTRGPGM